jgi:hypothetical protein
VHSCFCPVNLLSNLSSSVCCDPCSPAAGGTTTHTAKACCMLTCHQYRHPGPAVHPRTQHHTAAVPTHTARQYRSCPVVLLRLGPTAWRRRVNSSSRQRLKLQHSRLLLDCWCDRWGSSSRCGAGSRRCRPLPCCWLLTNCHCCSSSSSSIVVLRHRCSRQLF